jgi:hypothetical protein
LGWGDDWGRYLKAGSSGLDIRTKLPSHFVKEKRIQEFEISKSKPMGILVVISLSVPPTSEHLFLRAKELRDWARRLIGISLIPSAVSFVVANGPPNIQL